MWYLIKWNIKKNIRKGKLISKNRRKNNLIRLVNEKLQWLNWEGKIIIRLRNI